MEHGGHVVLGDFAETWSKLLEEPVGDWRPRKKLLSLGGAWGCRKARGKSAGRALSWSRKVASPGGS